MIVVIKKNRRNNKNNKNSRSRNKNKRSSAKNDINSLIILQFILSYLLKLICYYLFINYNNHIPQSKNE